MKKKIIKYQSVPIPFFTSKEGKWVDIKSICKLLEINYEDEVQRLSEHHLKGKLNNLSGVRTEVIKYGFKESAYLCVPLEDLSLYLSQIPLSSSPDIEKQRACRDDLPAMLYNS